MIFSRSSDRKTHVNCVDFSVLKSLSRLLAITLCVLLLSESLPADTLSNFKPSLPISHQVLAIKSPFDQNALTLRDAEFPLGGQVNTAFLKTLEVVKPGFSWDMNPRGLGLVFGIA